MNAGADGNGKRVSRRRALTIGGAAAVTALSAVGLPSSSPGTEPETGDRSIERVHAAGITGSGVRVGVLDTTGFAPSHPGLDDRVAALRSFDSAPLVVDRVTHGTAAAATVSDLAPDVTLLLASFSRPTGFASALEWFGRKQVDLVLTPVAAHGGTGSTVVDAAAATVDSGLPLVAPTGNAAHGHWSGPLGAAVGASLAVQPFSQKGVPSGRLVAWLGCEGNRVDCTLKLIRLTETGDGRDLVALSQPSDWGSAEKLTANLDPGEYVLEVGVPDHDEVPADVDEHPVSVVTPTHAVMPARPAGSIAPPASAPGVVAVGALSDRRLAPYSGRGPTPDGRVGVDVVAEPNSWAGNSVPGTSGAAARVAGTAALVLAAEPSLSPDALRGLLRTTAADMGSEGPDLGTGWGRLDPLTSVQRARISD